VGDVGRPDFGGEDAYTLVAEATVDVENPAGVERGAITSSTARAAASAASSFVVL